MSSCRWMSDGRTILSARSRIPRTTPSVVNIYTLTQAYICSSNNLRNAIVTQEKKTKFSSHFNDHITDISPHVGPASYKNSTCCVSSPVQRLLEATKPGLSFWCLFCVIVYLCYRWMFAFIVLGLVSQAACSSAVLLSTPIQKSIGKWKIRPPVKL